MNLNSNVTLVSLKAMSVVDIVNLDVDLFKTFCKHADSNFVQTSFNGLKAYKTQSNKPLYDEIADPTYKFVPSDEKFLEEFFKNVGSDKVLSLCDRVNLTKRHLDYQNSSFADMMNEFKGLSGFDYNSSNAGYDDLCPDGNGKKPTVNPFPFVFAIVKSIQYPEKYVLNYPFWIKMSAQYCSPVEGYEGLCNIHQELVIYAKTNNIIVNYPISLSFAFFRLLGKIVAHTLINQGTEKDVEKYLNKHKRHVASFVKEEYEEHKIDVPEQIRNNEHFPKNSQDYSKESTVNSVDSKNGDREPSTDIVNGHYPLNQILFGPPGTGKTFHTINKALEILEPTFKCTEENRDKAIEKFNQYKQDGRIVFTTFHQSMSYEDFIEGIKPQTNDARQVTYKVEDGIFKKICAKASAQDPVEEILKDFISHKTTFKKKGGQFWLRGIIGNLVVTEDDSNNATPILHLPLIKHIVPKDGEFKDRYEEIKEGRNCINSTEKSYYNPVIKEIRKRLKDNTKSNSKLPYVLIIDEINRGNIANIFGELITLIEDDKRIGEPEALEVQLPYSNKEEGPFGVPKNLYIIGTMNTADRSVEALDSALRRRFSFVEMMPKPELLAGVSIYGFKNTSLKDLLEVINKRIEVLKDREHQIGHSYFMRFAGKGSVEADALKEVFTDKIIPLLQEYFYGDYEKILLVLGEGFVKKEKTTVTFAGNALSEDISDFSYEIKDPQDMKEALAKLLNIDIKKEQDISDQSENINA